jgi:hypothetical protein
MQQETQLTRIESPETEQLVSSALATCKYSSGDRDRTLAIVTRSGLMLYFSQPNIVPSRPNAQMTCSSTSDNMMM